MYLHFIDLNFQVYLTDVEIEHTLSSPVFNPLSGDWSYPFTFASSPTILAKLDYPNLVNVNRVATISYKVLLFEVSLQLFEGVLALDYADENIITATLTVTPGNIAQAFWQKSLNKFDIGKDVIPTQNLNATLYKVDGNSSVGVVYDNSLGRNLTVGITMLECIKRIFRPTTLQIYKGTVLLSEKQTAQLGVTPTDTSNIPLFVEFLAAYNTTQQNNEVLFSNKQFLAVSTGISTDTFTVKFSFRDGNAGITQTATFILNPSTVSTITDYLDNSLKATWTKPYQLPEIDNTKHYSEDVFNGTINKTDAGKILRNANVITEKTKYSLVPMLYLEFVLRKIFSLVGYTVVGDFLQNVDVKKILIFNLYTLDKMLDGLKYPVNIYNNTITYANHLPDVKFGDYLQYLIDQFGLVLHFNLFVKTVELSRFNTNILKVDYLDLTGRSSYTRKIQYRKAKKQQLKWNISGDALAKENTAPYNPIPSDAVVEANKDDFEDLPLQIPGLTKNANRPQIEAQSISPLFAQDKNTSPLRFLFWDENKGKIETNTLSFDLEKATGIYKTFNKAKQDFNDNTLYFEISAKLTLQELVEFSFLRKILAYDVFWLASSISVKIRSDINKYVVELKLRRYIG
ncbi:hypothetical protein LV89_01976 [Arcicella aurantiaca]|uniref:Uncharacterized protein n=1 Tax=Arcicella aurantiaca TaxID=591202 RepID=A0A316EB39_9BACT|nr:hypothetical protein [Arcicella aurantiaca]PWK27161.1 hypothetical protein LV89_01976 [Arcicella aurantiaca]